MAELGVVFVFMCTFYHHKRTYKEHWTALASHGRLCLAKWMALNLEARRSRSAMEVPVRR